MTNQRFESTPHFTVGDDPVIIQSSTGSTSQMLVMKNPAGDVITSIGHSGSISSSSPVFTGIPTAPTATTGTNTTQIATTAFVQTEVSNLVASAPATLNTLDELAAALGDDSNFATTTATAIGLKAPLASPAFSGVPTAPTATAGTDTTQIANTQFVNTTVNSFLPAGMIAPYAGGSTPAGWLLCFGQLVTRATYPNLFASIGITYNTGGEALTDFRLPDLRGRTVAGVDNMGGVDAGRLDIANSSGTVVGTQYVTLTSAESGVPAHSHANSATFAGNAASHNHTQNPHTHATVDNGAPTGGSFDGSKLAYGTTADYMTRNVTIGSATATNQSTSITPTGSVTMTNVTNTAANAASAHNNMQPTMVLNYIIKV